MKRIERGNFTVGVQARPGYFGQSTRIRDRVRRIHVHQMSSNKKVGTLLPTFAALFPCSCPNRMRHFPAVKEGQECCRGLVVLALVLLNRHISPTDMSNAFSKTGLRSVTPCLGSGAWARLDLSPKWF